MVIWNDLFSVLSTRADFCLLAVHYAVCLKDSQTGLGGTRGVLSGYLHRACFGVLWKVLKAPPTILQDTDSIFWRITGTCFGVPPYEVPYTSYIICNISQYIRRKQRGKFDTSIKGILHTYFDHLIFASIFSFIQREMCIYHRPSNIPLSVCHKSWGKWYALLSNNDSAETCCTALAGHFWQPANLFDYPQDILQKFPQVVL